MADNIDRVIVDFQKNFGSKGLLLGVEPKMKRVDATNPNSEQKQATDKKTGVLQWTVSVALKYKQFDRVKNVTLDITVTSPSRPFANAPEGTAVEIEDLAMGVMKQDREHGGYSQFWSATAIRPVENSRPPATIRPTADDIRQPVPGRVPTGQ